MEYRRFQDTIIMRVDPEEEILEQLKYVTETEKVALAQVSGLGAVNDFTVGLFDTVAKEYHSTRFQGAFEIVSLTGTVTRKDGEAYLHIHLSAGDGKGNVYGGHLNKAVVSATAEIVINVIDGRIGREFNETIGLNLFKFEA